jgi:hypothetical protein
MSPELVSYAIIIGLLCAGIAGVIASRKNRSVGEAMFMSLALGLIGLLIVALMRPGEPKAPPGLRAVVCPRCNAQQNVPEGDSTFECWRCKLVTTQQRGRTTLRPRRVSRMLTVGVGQTEIICGSSHVAIP